MSMIKRYTNIYHPHFTGIARYMLTQGHLASNPAETDQLAQYNFSEHCAHSVELNIDSSVCVQADVACPEGYLVRYLNITMDDSSSCTQCGLYDTHEAALASAERWKNHPFNKGFEQFVYKYMAVPVVFKKVPIDPFFTLVPYNFNFENVFIEENSFHVGKEKKSYE